MADTQAAAYEQIIYDVTDGVATITMNRPDRMNAMTPVMNGEIRKAMQAASDDPAVRAIVLTGAGKGFCAGADVARLSSKAAGQSAEAEPLPVDGAIEGGIDLPEGYAAKYAWMTTVPKPVIAAVNGAAVGVGLVMALYSDYRICSERAKLGTAFAKRGLVAEYGLAWLLPRVVGPSKALNLLYSARLVTGDEAERMGLVDRSVAPEAVLEEAQAYARMLATEVSPRSTRVIKGLVWRSLIQSMDEAQDDSLAEMQTALESDDFREGIAAWQEKRAPKFTGS